jgi:glutamyl-tRNA reductase
VPVVVIGLNHRTVPIELLERFAISADALGKALHDLCGRSSVSEAVVLSTCNRTEVYAMVERFHPAVADIRDFLCDLAHVAPEEIADHVYSEHDTEAVRHLFAVSSGLESAVLGESEILGQVRTAWERAAAEGSARASLNLLFRHALEVGKRARTETAIGRSTASVSHSAVAMARDRLDTLEGRTVLVIGAGEVGEGIVVALAAAGAAEVLVANRTVDRAVGLAARVNGSAIGLDAVPDALLRADVVLTSTGAGLLVTEDTVHHRDGRPLLVIDVAVPRDVAASVGTLPDVTLLDLDDLREFASRGLAARAAEVDAVTEIVQFEVERFQSIAVGRQVAPLLSQLRVRAEELRVAELDRFASKLVGLDDRQREAVEALTRGLMAKLLHEPSVRLKAEAGTPQAERNAAALRDLFDLS